MICTLLEAKAPSAGQKCNFRWEAGRSPLLVMGGLPTRISLQSGRGKFIWGGNQKTYIKVLKGWAPEQLLGWNPNMFVS